MLRSSLDDERQKQALGERRQAALESGLAAREARLAEVEAAAAVARTKTSSAEASAEATAAEAERELQTLKVSWREDAERGRMEALRLESSLAQAQEALAVARDATDAERTRAQSAEERERLVREELAGSRVAVARSEERGRMADHVEVRCCSLSPIEFDQTIALFLFEI